MKYDFLNIGDQVDVSSVKSHKNFIEKFIGLKYFDDSISMWVSEMDFKMAPEIAQAMKERIDKGILGYTAVSKEYFTAVINWFDYKYSASIEKDWIVPSHGTVPAIRNTIRAFTKEGDGVIIQPPVYGQFQSAIKETSRKVVKNPLKKVDGKYEVDFEQFEKLASKEENKMFILCSPHNPVGKVFTSHELKKLLDIAKKYELIVFADEVHAEIVRSNTSFITSASFAYDNVITAVALSKAFNLTGIHVTTLVIPGAELKETYNAYTGFGSLSPLDMTAVIAAYNEARVWLEEVNQVIDSNFEIVKSFIDEHLPKVKFEIPDGSYLAWLDFSEYKQGTTDILKAIAEAGLVLDTGLMFGKEGKSHARMMIATTKPILLEALNRLKTAMVQLEG